VQLTAINELLMRDNGPEGQMPIDVRSADALTHPAIEHRFFGPRREIASCCKLVRRLQRPCFGARNRETGGTLEHY